MRVGDWLGVLVGEGVLVGVGEVVGVEDGSGVAHPASRAQSAAMANVFIIKWTVRVPRWLRKDRMGAPVHV